MKFISWNVNGLRACVKRDLQNFLNRQMQTFSVYRKQSFRRAD